MIAFHDKIQQFSRNFHQYFWVPYYVHQRIPRLIGLLLIFTVSLFISLYNYSIAPFLMVMSGLLLSGFLTISMTYRYPPIRPGDLEKMVNRLHHHPESWSTVAHWKNNYDWGKAQQAWSNKFDLPEHSEERNFILASLAFEQKLSEDYVIPPLSGLERKLTIFFQKDEVFWSRHLPLVGILCCVVMLFYSFSSRSFLIGGFSTVGVLFWVYGFSEAVKTFLTMSKTEHALFKSLPDEFQNKIIQADCPLSSYHTNLALAHHTIIEREVHKKLCEAAYLMIGKGGLCAESDRQALQTETLQIETPAPPVRRL